ncbi:prolactin-inducible protein homolog [Monodelphis domestica]|uniref:prolactin-inducible protein homolog n=1 Tax=Monodelphis domestica TaxID=13616 RepID=UPI0024E1B89A|nr:prolactin-inducible protein homolog [Monodelphis domestica]
MPPLQALVRYSITALILGLCLQLVTGQNEQNRKPLVVKMTPPPKNVKSMETTEIKCNVSTELTECVPIEFSILSNKPLNCDPPPFVQEACICPGVRPRNFYWNVCSEGTVKLYCVAQATPISEICEDEEMVVVPLKGNTAYDYKEFVVQN